MNQRIADAFLEGTKYQNLDPSDQQQGVDQPPLHAILRSGQRLALPDPRISGLGDIRLREAIETRRSLRTYSESPLRLEELSFL